MAPTNAAAYVNRAELNWRTKRYRDAINDATKAISLFPVRDHSAGEAYHWKSEAEQKLGMSAQANEDAKTAVKLGYKGDAFDIVTGANTNLQK